MGQQRIAVEGNHVKVKGDCEWSVKCTDIMNERVESEAMLGSSIVFTREHPLIGEPGCWLIRLCTAKISVFS